MVYVAFVSDKPVIADNGNIVIDNTRENLMALRDAIVAGALKGWWFTPSGGTAAEPAIIYYEVTRTGTRECVRLTITWGTTGGDDGQPKVIVYAYAPDWNGSTGTFDAIGTASMTYDGSGNMTDLQWS